MYSALTLVHAVIIANNRMSAVRCQIYKHGLRPQPLPSVFHFPLMAFCDCFTKFRGNVVWVLFDQTI